MALTTSWTVSVVVILACLSAVHQCEARGNPLLFVRDTGHATNCGTVPFNVSWTPKAIHPSGEITVHVDYTTPVAFDGGFLNASISVHGNPDPLIAFANEVSCADVKKYVPVCPISKGFHINMSRTFRDLNKTADYPGIYDLMAHLTDKKGKELICIKITIEIVPV